MRFVLLVVALVVSAPAAYAATADRPSLWRVEKDGARTELPLVRGHVSCKVRGPIAQVTLTQRYANPHTQPIEAIYVFPLPHDGAIGGMTMRIGSRTIQAVIEKRDAARARYDAAKDAGHTAALLEQERPNVFTQSVANIAPGEQIDIELAYDVLLEPDDDQYELAL